MTSDESVNPLSLMQLFIFLSSILSRLFSYSSSSESILLEVTLVVSLLCAPFSGGVLFQGIHIIFSASRLLVLGMLGAAYWTS